MAKKEKSEKTSFKNQLSSLLDVPPEVVSDLPKITMMGALEFQIENYTSLLEYTMDRIRISTTVGVIVIDGHEMQAIKMTDELIKIKGNIRNINFLR